MTFAHHSRPYSGLVVRPLGGLLLILAALSASSAARALDTGDIVIANLKGEVHFEIRGSSTTLRSGSMLELPATLRTGRDGAVELRQGATSISVGPDTLLEFPALKEAGGPIDRIVQPRGNAFYSIGKRNGRKLRIETPFLVGVVKGTQFNVAAQDHATTISLFEGLLEVRSADDSDVVDLRAGEIASRDRTASDISVFKMEGSKPPPIAKPSAGTGSGGGASAPGAPASSPSSKPAPTPTPTPAPRSNSGESMYAGRAPENLNAVAVGELGDASVDLGVRGNSGPGDGDGKSAVVDLGLNANSGNALNVDLGVGTNSGDGNSNPTKVDLGVSGNSGEGNGSTPNVDLGVSGNSGSGNSSNVELGVSGNSGSGNSSTVDLGVNGNSGSGNSANVDLGVNGNSGNGNSANVDLGVGANIGTTATPDTAIDVGIDVELGLDTGNPGNGNGNGNGDNGNPADVVNDVTDIVNGLLKKPGRK